MEDEECLPENSSLKLYLQNLGFTDIQVTKSTSPKPSTIQFELVRPKHKWPCVETIDEDIIDQISIIVSTQMLFEEDVSNVEKLLSTFKVVRNGMFKSMFKDLFSVTIIFLGLCLYWIIGYYAFFIVSSFYAFMAANYLRRKHFSKKRLEKLTSVLQANFILLKKTVKFIEENRLIETNETNKTNLPEFLEGFNFYKNFKSEFLISVSEIISILINSTQKLINKVPLYDYIENPEYYLCNNFNKNYEFVDLPKLYDVYLLVQSEFLQRLILSLIPNIKLTKDDFHEINKILTETCVGLLKIKNKLNKKYKFLFLNGIHSAKSKINFKLPFKDKFENSYCKDFVLNIHEASKTFQNLLLQCRILEEKILSEKILVCAEEELVKMQSDLFACQRNINDSLILLKKATFLTENPNKFDKVKIQNEEEVKSSTEKLNKILVGYTDLDPKIDDEIFEIYFSNENCSRTLPDNEDWNLDSKLEKKMAKEYSENVMKELKLKLVEKAEYWKKRERELLMKKGLTDVDEDLLEHEQKIDNLDEQLKEKAQDKNEKTDLQMPCKFSKVKFEKNYSNDVEDFEHLEINITEREIENHLDETETKLPVPHTNHTEHISLEFSKNNEIETLNSSNDDLINGLTHENSLQTFNKDLLNDLNQARQKIFKSSFAIKEELFCVSGEDSSSDDNPT